MLIDLLIKLVKGLFKLAFYASLAFFVGILGGIACELILGYSPRILWLFAK